MITITEIPNTSRSQYDSSPNLCAICKKTLPYEKRFNKCCSQSCASTRRNSGVRRHGKPPNSCLICGEKTTDHRKRFCSHQCQKEFDYRNFIEKWLNGLVSGNTGKKSETAISCHIQKWVRRERGEKCEKCGWTYTNQYTKKIPLNLHHKDGDSEHTRPENLELLCPNCHSLTKTYGGANKGCGRGKKLVFLVRSLNSV